MVTVTHRDRAKRGSSMPPTSFASEGVRVVVPGSYDVRQASRARALPGDPGFEHQVAKDAIVASLEDSGLVTMQRLDLSPRRDRDLPGADLLRDGGEPRLARRHGRPRPALRR